MEQLPKLKNTQGSVQNLKIDVTRTVVSWYTCWEMIQWHKIAQTALNGTSISVVISRVNNSLYSPGISCAITKTQSTDQNGDKCRHYSNEM